MLLGMQFEDVDQRLEPSTTTAPPPTEPPPVSRDGHPPLEPGPGNERSPPAQGWRRWPLLIATTLFVLVQAGPWLLGSIGAWLVVEDEIAPADVIFVHAGELPFRSMEAAELYRDGYAPEVWISSIRPNDRSRALESIGLVLPGSHYWERQVLERLGVPARAIRLVDEQVLNTRDEIQAVRSEMQQHGHESVILVTSKAHSRRVRLLWSETDDGSMEGAVRWSHADPFEPSRWWTNTEDGQKVLHELAGIVDVWVGGGWRPERE